MVVIDLLHSNIGDLRLSAPQMDGSIWLPRYNTDQLFHYMMECAMADMQPYLDALPKHHLETLLVRLVIAMGIEPASLHLVRRYENDGGVLVSGRWATLGSKPVNVLVRIAYQESAVRAAGIAEMLKDRDDVDHILVFMPHTRHAPQTAPNGSTCKELVFFVYQYQILALLMGYGIGCQKGTIPVSVFDQGFWLSEVNAASIAYSRLVAEPRKRWNADMSLSELLRGNKRESGETRSGSARSVTIFPRGQLSRNTTRAADIDEDEPGDEMDDLFVEDSLEAMFESEDSIRMMELDWSDSFDDFDSQDWYDYNSTVEFDDGEEEWIDRDDLDD